jgi:hypothetical protein
LAKAFLSGRVVHHVCIRPAEHLWTGEQETRLAESEEMIYNLVFDWGQDADRREQHLGCRCKCDSSLQMVMLVGEESD